MEAKALIDFAQLSDREFFAKASEGLKLICENAFAVRDSAQNLFDDKCYRGYQILRLTAEEEAAKFLILLDAVRCPRNLNEYKEIFSRQLRCFYDHLCRGIYVEYYRLAMGYDFKDVRAFVEDERAECYLDGPDFLCWVMPNRIRSRRENKIYVDYIRTESGNFWTSPVNDPDVALNLFGTSLDERVFDVVNALYHVTEAKPEALEMIASLWRPIRMSDGTGMDQIQEWNTATVNALQNHGIGNEATQEHIACVKECWRFPLYDLDLGMREVSKKEITSILEAEKEAFWRSVT